MTNQDNIGPRCPSINNNGLNVEIPRPGDWRDRLDKDIENFKNSPTPNTTQLLLMIGVMKNDIDLVSWSLEHGADPAKFVKSGEILILRAYGFNMDM